MIERIKSLAAAETAGMIAFRQELHQHPEVSYQEEWTAARLCAELEALGVPYERKGRRGILARLIGAAPGPHIAFRADFDALAIQEETGLPYASREEGRMHACGHDGHTAVLRTLVRTMAANRDLLRGTVTFLFQDAEELPPGGAAAMVADGCLEGVDRIYALHVSDELDTGVIGVREGKYMAASDCFNIAFTGRGGHGSRPNDGDDTISALAATVGAIDAIPSRFLPAYTDAVVTVCAVNGGTSYNVLPARCTMMGTVRTFEAETAREIRARIELCAQTAAQLFHTGYEYKYQEGYPAVVNDPDCCRTVRGAAALLGRPCIDIPPTTVAEDFSFYQQQVPGAFFRVGIRNPEKEAVYPLHSGKFRLDEDALPVALEMLWCIYLQETGQLSAPAADQ